MSAYRMRLRRQQSRTRRAAMSATRDATGGCSQATASTLPEAVTGLIPDPNGIDSLPPWEGNRRGPTRVTLIPWRNDFSEIEKDTTVAVECMVACRGLWRRGDVETIPITVGFMQWWLKKTGARRQGRDHARGCIATAVELGLIEDTGETRTPRRQPHPHLHIYWWRKFRICALARLREARWSGGLAALPASLRRWADGQGLIFHRPRPNPGSVQWVFANSGPP